MDSCMYCLVSISKNDKNIRYTFTQKPVCEDCTFKRNLKQYLVPQCSDCFITIFSPNERYSQIHTDDEDIILCKTCNDKKLKSK